MYLARSLSLIRSYSNSLTLLNASNSTATNQSTTSNHSLSLSNESLSSFGNYRMHITKDREKAENALFEHVRKAVNSQETAPKQKHVRGKHKIVTILISNIYRMHCFYLG